MARLSKQARTRRTVRVLLIIVIVLALLVGVVFALRRQVTSDYNARGAKEALTASVTRGSISSTVTGSGNLADEDVEPIRFHSGVRIDEILVETGDSVQAGDLLATVDMSSVLAAMADLQKQLDELDAQIRDEAGNELDDEVITALPGRVKAIFAAEDADVSSVMYDHGALALLSLDGYMTLRIDAGSLSVGDGVTVTGSDGQEYAGFVDSLQDGLARILVGDDGPAWMDTVSVRDEAGTLLGSDTLEIHEMLKITAIAGTVSDIRVSENQLLRQEQTLFDLTDTSFSANYTSLLEERRELEDQLQQLIRIYREGAVYAAFGGTVSEIPSGETTDATLTSYGALTVMPVQEEALQTLLSICPGKTMTVKMDVDETSILSLSLGLEARITVEALGDQEFTGTVTGIDTTASASGGVSAYSVTVTLDKGEKMLAGMSADLSIRIEGVENALLIPSDALTQTSAASYVYTSFDPETGKLGSMIEVTAGLNNGDFVEITGGLNEGDTVYYFESDKITFSFGGMTFTGSGDMGGMTFPSGMSNGFSGRGQ